MVEDARSLGQAAKDAADDVVVDDRAFIRGVGRLLSSPPAPKPTKKVGPAGTSRRPRSLAERDREVSTVAYAGSAASRTPTGRGETAHRRSRTPAGGSDTKSS